MNHYLEQLESQNGVLYIGESQPQLTISSVAAHALGIEITTSAAHLRQSGEGVLIAGTTDYDGLDQILKITSDTKFVVGKAFTTTKTGTADFNYAIGRFAGFKVIKAPVTIASTLVASKRGDAYGLLNNDANLVKGDEVILEIQSIQITAGDIKLIRLPGTYEG